MSLLTRALPPLAVAASAALTAACIQAPPVRPPADVLEVGNREGSRVALEVNAGTGTLRYLTSAVDDDERARLAELAPNVELVAGLTADEALALAHTVHGADAHLVTPAFLEAATELRWVQSWSAGVERYLAIDELVARDEVVLTNMKGVHGPVIAEHVMALLLSLCRDLPAYHAAQRAGTWDRGAGSGQRALAGSTMLVAGMGGIGTEVAERAFGFDMRVLATVRRAREAPAFVHELGTADDLDRFLPQADVVVIALPLTDETRGLFDAARLDAMKDDAILVNIARGAIVDTDALVAALDEGRLAGAALDVTDPEPLPAGHALWGRDDVLITPHVAGRAALTGERRDLLFAENLARFAAGEPLWNVVDKDAGY